jgi:hypothetical protein
MKKEHIEGAISTLALTGATLVGLWWFDIFPFNRSDDDRPPVVVSSGSVEVVSKASSDGEYGVPTKPDPANNKVWKFTHSKRGPMTFMVLLAGSLDHPKPGCETLDPNRGVSELMFNFKHADGSKTFNVSIQGGFMQFDFPVDATTMTNGLTIADVGPLTSVKYRRGQSGAWTECGLDGTSKVGIYHRQ